MSHVEIQSFIEKIRNRYILLRLTETMLLAAACSLLLYAVLHLTGYDGSTKIIVAASGAVMLFLVRIVQLGLINFKKSIIASYLSRNYKDLEESADLLVADDNSLSLLQLIQKQRAADRLEALRNDIRLPHRLSLAAGALILGAMAWFGVITFSQYIPPTQPQPTGIENTVPMQGDVNQPVSISEISVQIVPPAYTSMQTIRKNDFNLVVPESSQVRWSVQFTRPPAEVRLSLSSGDTLLLEHKGSAWEASRKIEARGFYSLQWIDNFGIQKSSNYFKIEVTKDQTPKIKITDLPQFTEYEFAEVQQVKFNAAISDDYGISTAHIIATVSKGSGESVKFREEKLSFDSPLNANGKQSLVSRSLNFEQLGMTPGDELYFYIEAFDNKAPDANHARTETWFIALKDTAREEIGFDSGMGVDLMPAYFRSQRQIIIDTEKLLAEKAKKQVTKENFNFRSNELGYDQKVLRLRYGQFLGEEFESTVVPENPATEAEDEETDVTKKFAHTHDKENEHNLVKEKTEVKPDNHKHDETETEDPMDAIAHKHDTGEESTFFVQSVKTKLKAALTLMWDAELQLRLYEPAKSLPVQYKILKLLQEISKDSRVYVHRNGFDPPPLKEEKRLTGDLEELKNTKSIYASDRSKQYPAIREALQSLGSLPAMDSIQLDVHQRTLLLHAGNELAGIALEQPGEYLETLSLIKSVSENELDKSQVKPAIQKIIAAFWNALPPGTASPARKNRSLHPLDRSFVKHLDLQKNEQH